jgi:serine/threonine protein kinase
VSEPRRIAGRYEVQPLDGGGMGTIWKGYDTVLDRLVAIKQIRPDRAAVQEDRRELAERFRREARVTARIEHPGVPAVYDAAIDADNDDIEQLYLIMQLVQGVTVADLIAEHGPLPISWAAAVGAQVCAVLSYAHAIPVVHRDLKPGNVMVDRSGHVKVLDFGVAAVLGTDVTRLTQTGRMVGSRSYMSPEQFHGVGVSPRSDLYGLGCLLHEMLAGRKVFEGASDPALQHVHDPPTPLRVLRPDVDERLERLVLDLLAKSPEDRPASAQEVFDRLVPFLPRPDDPPEPAGPAGDPPDPTGPYRRPLAPRRTAEPLSPVPGRAGSVPGSRHQVVADPSVTGRPLPADVEAHLDSAEEHANGLLDQERFAQAADVLGDALTTPQVRSAFDHPRVLEARSAHAAVLFLGGDYRRALAAFDALTAAYTRVVGPRHQRVLECRKQAAYCHAELGDTETALAGFRAVLSDLGGDQRTTEVLELRMQIGILLLTAQRLREAANVLRPLEHDFAAVRPPGDPDLQEVRDLLTRIRLTGGTSR